MPENGDDAQVHRNDESGFDGLELVAKGDGRRSRQCHTELSHVVSSNAHPGIRPRPPVFYWMYECPVGFRHQKERTGETTPSPFCEAVRLASEKIIPAGGQAFTPFDGNRRSENSSPLSSRVTPHCGS